MEALGDALDLEHKSVWAMEEGQKTALAKLRCGMAMPYCGLGLLAMSRGEEARPENLRTICMKHRLTSLLELTIAYCGYTSVATRVIMRLTLPNDFNIGQYVGKMEHHTMQHKPVVKDCHTVTRPWQTDCERPGDHDRPA